MKSNRKLRDKTLLIRGGLNRSNFEETSEAIYLSSGFTYETAEKAEAAFLEEVATRFKYSRYANPSNDMFEKKLKLIEGAKFCRSLSSGMASIWYAILAGLKPGSHIVSTKAMFGSCAFIVSDLLPKLGFKTTMIDGQNIDDWQEAFNDGVDIVLLETPSNPMLSIFDIKAISALAHDNGAYVIIDNAFASPILQKPLELGADIVCYSATKFIDGQGRTLSGAILTNDEKWFMEDFDPWFKHTGPTLSAFNAWLLTKSLDTLALRVNEHTSNAQKVADYLDNHKKVGKVYYPGLKSHEGYEIAKRQMSGPGAILAFELKGDKQATFDFMNKLEIIDISNNLGDSKSLITHPDSTTHQNVETPLKRSIGITERSMRLSVGLEDVNDLIEDIELAL